MVRSLGVRYFAIVAIILSAGFADVATAATTSASHQLERLDLGDDDGDGIPNYLDPDDNNDGIQDRDTSQTPVPTAEPIVEAPDNDAIDVDTPTETPVPDTGSETEPEQAPPKEDPGTDAAPEAVPETPADPPAQAAAPQVSSLPNTGTGPLDSVLYITASALVLVVLGAGGFLLFEKRR